MRVHGLVKAAHHNGKLGRLLRAASWADEAERAQVALDDAAGAAPLLVKRANLEQLVDGDAGGGAAAAQAEDVLGVD